MKLLEPIYQEQKGIWRSCKKTKKRMLCQKKRSKSRSPAPAPEPVDIDLDPLDADEAVADDAAEGSGMSVECLGILQNFYYYLLLCRYCSGGSEFVLAFVLVKYVNCLQSNVCRWNETFVSSQRQFLWEVSVFL